MTREFGIVLILVLTPFMLSLVWTWIRRRRGPGSGFHPAKQRRPGRALRRTEAFAILAIGLAAVLITGTRQNPVVKEYGLSGSGAPGALVLLAGFFLVTVFHFLALFGRTRIGALMLVAAVIAAPFAYAYINEQIDEGPATKQIEPPVHIFRIEHQGLRGGWSESFGEFRIRPEIRGAELWVNGVRLGPIPVRITREEFRAKVPHWDQPPEGFDHELARFNTDTKGFSGRYDEMKARWSEWFEITLEGAESSEGQPRKPWEGDPSDLYYARLKLGEEWGVGGGYATTHKYPEGPYLTDFHVEFRDYNTCLDNLINQARLLGENLSPEWLSAFESYGTYGEICFDEAIEMDPTLEPAVAAWARWRYGFSKNPGPDRAWEALEAVCAHADRLGKYDSRSLTGHAVEVLVTSLDPEQLARETAKRLRHLRSRTLRIYIATYEPDRTISASGKSRYGSPPSFAVLLHACRDIDRLLDREDNSEPNIVERRIPRELLRWGEERREIGGPLWLAFDIGGPDFERYIRRHDWQSEEYGDATSLAEAGRVNRWFYLLVLLDSPAGDQFRQRHRREVLDLAEDLAHGISDLHFHRLDFLFFDLERGDDSLAMRFWPRFENLVADDGDFGKNIELMFLYLNRMGPLATDEMYLEYWRKYVKHFSATEGLRALEELPDEKHRRILESIFADVRRNREHYLRKLGERSDPEHHLEVWIEYEFPQMLELIPAEQRAMDVVGWVLNPYRADRVMDLIKRHPEEIPLVAAAAHHEETRFRLRATELVVDYPSRDNQALLDELINDPEKEVRSAAKKAAQELAKLAATPPFEFAHPLAGGDDSERSH